MACRVAGAALVLPGDAGDAGGTSLAVLVAASGARFARRRAGRGHELARNTVVACLFAGAALVLPGGAGDAGGARRAVLVAAGCARVARRRAGRGHGLARSTGVACLFAGAALVLSVLSGGASDAGGARRAVLVLPRIADLARHGGHRPGRRVLARGAVLAVARRRAGRGHELARSAVVAPRVATSALVLPRRTGLARCGAPGVLVLSLGTRGANVVAVPKLVCTCE